MEAIMARFNRGKVREAHPEYRKYVLRNWRRRGTIRELQERGEKETPAILEMKRQIEEDDRACKKLPSKNPLDHAFRRLHYCRYADDTLMGVIGSKDDAYEVMAQVKVFAENGLHLSIAESKSKISHASEGTIFLSYEVISRSTAKLKRVKSTTGIYTRKRTVAERMTLRIPEEKLLKFCHTRGYGNYNTLKTKHRPVMRERSDAEIILAYNAEIRGLINYYCLAFNLKRRLAKLYWLWQGGLFKTLAHKHKMTVMKVISQLRRENGYVYTYEAKGKMRNLSVVSLRHWKPSWTADRNVDIQPYIYVYTKSRTEIIQRLNAETCEYCGRSQGYFEVHHVRKLEDIKDGKPLWQQVMSAMRRKTLVLCAECHDLLHSGRLPDWRRRSQIEAESRMR
jgi:hypothetical protein